MAANAINKPQQVGISPDKGISGLLKWKLMRFVPQRILRPSVGRHAPLPGGGKGLPPYGTNK